MNSFDDYRADTGFNNLAIQRALREIDTEVLATALVGLSEGIRGMFYRNMSRRTTTICEEDIQLRGGRTSQARIEAAQAVLLGLLRQHGEQAKDEELQPDQDQIPEIRLDSQDAIIVTFRALASYVRKHGFLPLGEIEDSIDDPFMRKGIQFLVDGTEPMLTRSILERYKKTLLQSYETRLDMMLEGIDTLASRYLPQLVEDKLKAHIPSD